MVSSLYVHIPFCISKCHYCDFFSVRHDALTADRYVDALCIELWERSADAGELDTIYIGGGTPTSLDMGPLERLLGCIRENFRCGRSIEATIEANPLTITEQKLAGLASNGINRLSIGVQSFSDPELKRLGRAHTAADAHEAVRLAHVAGLSDISIDLIYGIPGQTIESWTETIEAALEIGVTHISSYELTPEEGTLLKEGILSGQIRLPDEEMTIAMYETAIEKCAVAGFDHYEISNFALPGHSCRHNLNYWNRGAYIGTGAGAHSFIDGRRSRNICNIERYLDLIASGFSPVEEETRIDPAEASREVIFLGLRKTEGIALDELSPLAVDATSAFRRICDDGLVEIVGDRLRLTHKGRLVSNTVFVRLFQDMGL